MSEIKFANKTVETLRKDIKLLCEEKKIKPPNYLSHMTGAQLRKCYLGIAEGCKPKQSKPKFKEVSSSDDDTEVKKEIEDNDRDIQKISKIIKKIILASLEDSSSSE